MVVMENVVKGAVWKQMSNVVKMERIVFAVVVQKKEIFHPQCKKNKIYVPFVVRMELIVFVVAVLVPVVEIFRHP
jgi:hypothetical protein